MLPFRKLQAVIQKTRDLGLVALLCLITLGITWERWLAPLPGGTGWLFLKILPLLFAVPGFWRFRLYTFRWMSLLIWLYVTEGLVRATTETGLVPILAWTEVALSLTLFTCCALHVRSRLNKNVRLPLTADQ
jgi:uncharacterized membrane protein